MKKFIDWLVVSSENPNKIALTLKGILGTVVSLVLLVSPLAHLNVNSEQLTPIVDGIVRLVLGIASLVSTLAMIVGFVRKIYLTGKNPSAISTLPVTTVAPEQPVITQP